MQLVITSNNFVLATHTEDQVIAHLYPNTKIYHVFDTQVMPLTSLLDLDLTILKTMQRRYIEDQFNEVRKAGYTCSNDMKLQCEEKDLFRWGQAKDIIELANLTEILVRDYDNNDTLVSVEDFNTMMIEIGVYTQSLLAAVWAKKNLVDAATTREQVLSITLG